MKKTDTQREEVGRTPLSLHSFSTDLVDEPRSQAEAASEFIRSSRPALDMELQSLERLLGFPSGALVRRPGMGQEPAFLVFL